MAAPTASRVRRPSALQSRTNHKEVEGEMIVLAADMHKRSHTVAAVVAATAEWLDDRTAAVGEAGFRDILEWGRGLGEERVWALEDWSGPRTFL